MSVESSRLSDCILVVDDEPQIVALVVYHLNQAGYRTLTATSGAKAIEAATSNSISLIILDLLLPDMPGFEVLTTIRSHQPPQCRCRHSPDTPE